MSKNTSENKHIVDVLFVLGLFLVFSISSLLLVLLGSHVYKNTVNTMDKDFNSRTAYAYLTEKVRQNDLYDSVSIQNFDGCEALVLTQLINDTSYSTYLYTYEGNLKELFTNTGNQLSASSGQDILPAKDFHAAFVADGLLSLSLTAPDNEVYQFYASTHCNNSK